MTNPFGNVNASSLIAAQAAKTAEMQKAANGVASARGTQDLDKIRQAAEDFESVFISEMLKPMFEGLEPDPMFGGGKGEEIFQSFMITEYGKNISKQGGIGIAKVVMDELIKLQSGGSNAEVMSKFDMKPNTAVIQDAMEIANDTAASPAS